MTSKSGRGPSAAKMEAADAVNLFIALATSPTAAAAPEVVWKFRRLRWQSVGSNDLEGWPRTTFGAFADFLFEAYVRGEIDDLMRVGIEDAKFVAESILKGRGDPFRVDYTEEDLKYDAWLLDEKSEWCEPPVAEPDPATYFFLEFERDLEEVRVYFTRFEAPVLVALFEDRSSDDEISSLQMTTQTTLWEHGVEVVCNLIRGTDGEPDGAPS